MKQASYSEKPSISRLFVHFVLMLVLINVASFTITVLEGIPRVFLTEYSWTLQFLFPVLYACAQLLLNSNRFIRPEKRNTPNIFLLEQAEKSLKNEKTEPKLQKMKKAESYPKTLPVKKLTAAE